MKTTKVRDLGRLIRARRLQLGWSQSKLAEQAQTTRRWISEVEHGKATAEIGLVLATLQALGLTLRLEWPATPAEPPRSRPAGVLQPSAADLADLLSRHVETGARKTSALRLLRRKR